MIEGKGCGRAEDVKGANQRKIQGEGTSGWLDGDQASAFKEKEKIRIT